MKMKPIFPFLLTIIILFGTIASCEKHKDPFSALNKKPELQLFAFDADSLKFKRDLPFYIRLKYQDDEGQQLTATFTFISGSGDIFQSDFRPVSKTKTTQVFQAPSSFDGRLSFLPDTTGKVEIELELSDRVKLSTGKATTFFYFNLKPVAKFTYRLLSSVSPYDVEVDASSSYDRDEGNIEWYYWWFADGTSEIRTRAKTWRHTYQKAGSYPVRLKVVDNDGGNDSTIVVIPTNNQPPVAQLQVQPSSGQAPLTIRYTATNSFDPDGRIVAYRIDFDDGTSALDSAGTHIYSTDKNYRVRLQVTDNLGQTDTTGITVRVSTPPVAVLNVTPVEGPFPLDCIIDGTDSYDPQGGKLKHDIYISGELRYSGTDSVVHTFFAPEKYQIRLLVTSERNGLTDQKVQSVNVVNLNPKADFIWYPEKPQPRTIVRYTSTSTDSNLTDYISYYKWTFPDGVEQGEDKAIVDHQYSLDFNPYVVKLEVWDKYRGTKFEGYSVVVKTVPSN